MQVLLAKNGKKRQKIRQRLQDLQLVTDSQVLGYVGLL